MASPDPLNDDTTAKMAFTLLQKHRITPIPENYAVWFHYALGQNKELVHEVDNIIKNRMTFTQETCSYLHHKFILGNRNQKVLDDAAISAQKVLVQVLTAINSFSSETQTYSKDVDTYLDDISHKFEDPDLKGVVKSLIEATTNMKKRGEEINERLEVSTQEITTLKKNLQKVTIEAQRDFLTGVFNRKTFEKMIDEQIIAVKEHPSDLCLLMVDIDHFKQFNDKFGHLLGDEVLKTVARTLTDTLKGRDIVARFGGEEFVVILPDTPMDGAMKVAEMIRSAIAGKELKRRDTGESFGSITVSIGVAHYRPAADTLPTLIKRADDAMYYSKHTGRNKVTHELT